MDTPRTAGRTNIGGVDGTNAMARATSKPNIDVCELAC
jgi:hypothetical protein